MYLYGCKCVSGIGYLPPPVKGREGSGMGARQETVLSTGVPRARAAEARKRRDLLSIFAADIVDLD